MSEKFYSPDEVAKMVLNKVLDTYKNSKLAKSNTSHEIEAGQEPTAPDAEAPEQLTGKNLKGMKQSKQAGGKKAEGEHEDAEQDLEQNLDVMDEHNEEMHDEPESEDSAYEYEEESEESDEDEEEDKKLPFTKSEKGIDLIKNFLGKREELAKADKDIKGVHKPATMHGAKSGVSEAGVRLHPKATKETKKYSKDQHKKVIEEQKSMKKPNLPKSECESEPSLQKESMKKANSTKEENIKGVHRTMADYGSAGQSFAGANARAAKRAKESKKNGSKEVASYNNQTAKQRHRDVISEQKSMKKPNLPKSENME